MGCFCRRAVLALQDQAEHGAPPAAAGTPVTPSTALVAAASDWLAARWLPAPAWQPDLAWLDAAVPDPPMRPEALSVLTALVQAQQACAAALGADPAKAGDGPKLARIVRTLNQRGPALQALAADPRPWASLAALAAQADTVREAAAQGAFHPVQEAPITPWRPLLARLKALAPLLAVAQLLGVDPARGDLPEALAGLVRKLRAISVPALADPGLVMRLIAQGDAVARLRRSLGADPRGAPFARVRDAVLRKVDDAAALLPQTLKADGGRLTGAPARQPNPGSLINGDVIKLAQALPAAALARMQWQVPAFDQFPLLTTLAPVASLAAALGGAVVRQAPCGPDCDAGPF